MLTFGGWVVSLSSNTAVSKSDVEDTAWLHSLQETIYADNRVGSRYLSPAGFKVFKSSTFFSNSTQSPLADGVNHGLYFGKSLKNFSTSNLSKHGPTNDGASTTSGHVYNSINKQKCYCTTKFDMTYKYTYILHIPHKYITNLKGQYASVLPRVYT